MIEFVNNHFNKANFVDVTFKDFKTIYSGKLKGHDITKVAKLLGINTTEKKEFKPKSVGKKKDK